MVSIVGGGHLKEFGPTVRVVNWYMYFHVQASGPNVVNMSI